LEKPLNLKESQAPSFFVRDVRKPSTYVLRHVVSEGLPELNRMQRSTVGTDGGKQQPQLSRHLDLHGFGHASGPLAVVVDEVQSLGGRLERIAHNSFDSPKLLKTRGAAHVEKEQANEEELPVPDVDVGQPGDGGVFASLNV
jgi:hypothetical protein